VTWVDPRGGRGGEFLYSAGLLGALAQAGATVEVLCHGNGVEAQNGDPKLIWHKVPVPTPASTWHSLLSALPNVAWRSSRGGAGGALAAQLARGGWDAVVVDALHAGWALAPIIEGRRRDRGQHPRLVYVAHNHEESTRRRVAAGARGNPMRRFALAVDAEKAAALERRIVAEADLVTAITEEDAARFRAQRDGRPVAVLTPGYDGPRRSATAITPDTPRRAVMLGSFHWVAKRMNLERFLAVADPIFAAAGAELRVVGDGPAEMFPRLRKRCTATRFTGPVDDIAPHIADARIALVPEEAGGGFKLKALDYVFNRLPIAALAGSVAGTPLEPPEAMLEFSTLHDLAEGALEAMDDCARLNRIQERAFTRCADHFDWAARGTELCRAIAELP
jgi:glycosyltransferase involved in cell wall biosynthesis